MGLTAWLIEREKRFAWSLLGTFLGVIGLVYAYISVQEKRPEIALILTSAVNVLDVNAPVRDLNVTFQNQNIQQQNLNLRIITIRLENTGDVDILQSYYDQQQRWGFEIEPGRVVEARMVSSNSSYLLSSLQPNLQGDSIVLNKTILERGRYADFAITVLHPKGAEPNVRSFGKIVGIDRLLVIDNNGTAEKGFFARAFAGGFLIQAVRLFGYFLGFIVSLFLLIAPFVVVGTMVDNKRKNARTEAVSALLEKAPKGEKYVRFFARQYIEGGKDRIAFAEKLLTNQRLLTKHAIRVDALNSRIFASPAQTDAESREHREDLFVAHDLAHPGFRIADELSEMGGIDLKGTYFEVKPEVIDAFNVVISFLRDRDLL